MTKLLLATHNEHKTREFRKLLGNDFDVCDLNSFGEITIPKETGRTFAENAVSKAVAASKDRHLLVAADDSGLEVDALDGAPGIFSARYAGENATDKQNIDKLLGGLRRAGATTGRRNARFRCVIALAQDGNLCHTFEGAVEGKIIESPRGTHGFGYDPVFQPNGFDETFGEMAPEMKNRLSHRAKAIAALSDALRAGEFGRAIAD